LGIIEGPIVATLAGFLVGQGNLHFTIVYVMLVLGDLVADAGYYAIGLFGREKFLEKYKKYTHIGVKEAEKLEVLFHHHTGKTIILAKLTHVLGVPFLVAAGLARTKFIPFLTYNTIATLIKTFAFMLLGYYSKQAADKINVYLTYGTYISVGLLVLLILGYFMFSKYMYKHYFLKEVKDENRIGK